MSRPITIINNGIIKSQQSINHQNHISLTNFRFIAVLLYICFSKNESDFL